MWANACIFRPVSLPYLLGPPGSRQARTPYPNGDNPLFFIFWQGTMASNSKVWTPILSASHLAAHCPCACWRSQTDGAKAKNHVICKKKADIKFQGSQTSWQRLSLEIVSIMLQKGSRTRGNPGRVQHTLETCLNLCREYRHTSGLDSDHPCTP